MRGLKNKKITKPFKAGKTKSAEQNMASLRGIQKNIQNIVLLPLKKHEMKPIFGKIYKIQIVLLVSIFLQYFLPFYSLGGKTQFT